MQAVETKRTFVTMAEAGTAKGGEIGQRIEDLKQLRALCGRLAPARERRYADAIGVAAAASAGALPRAEALLELDLLSLELCDD